MKNYLQRPTLLLPVTSCACIILLQLRWTRVVLRTSSSYCLFTCVATNRQLCILWISYIWIRIVHIKEKVSVEVRVCYELLPSVCPVDSSPLLCHFTGVLRCWAQITGWLHIECVSQLLELRQAFAGRARFPRRRIESVQEVSSPESSIHLSFRLHNMEGLFVYTN